MSSPSDNPPLSAPAFSLAPTKHEIEEGSDLLPKFDQNGLMTAVAVDADSGEVLMVAFMNEEAFDKTIATGEAWYWSRSRNTLWHKGDSSHQIQTVIDMRIDCDQDCVVLRVKVGGDGGCCHTGRKSCFYRYVRHDGDGPALVMVEKPA